MNIINKYEKNKRHETKYQKIKLGAIGTWKFISECEKNSGEKL